MVKNYRSIFFLLIFINALVGRTLAFIIIRDQLKKDCRTECASNALNSYFSHCFKVKATNRSHIKWIEKEQEFMLNGRCYDVLSIEKSGNYDLLYCIEDGAETRLFKAYIDSEEADESPLSGLKSLFKSEVKFLTHYHLHEHRFRTNLLSVSKLVPQGIALYSFFPFFDIEYPPEV